MTNTKAIISFCLTLSIASFAGGAASLVGKKAASNEGIFSSATQTEFINDCSEDASLELCSCVLDKLQHKYTESEYLKLDADLRNNKDRPEFTAFISNATDECSKDLPEKTASGIPERDAQNVMEEFFKEVSMNDYVSDCNSQMSILMGDAQGKKICECSYNHMKNNKDKFVQLIMDFGMPEDNDIHWSKENMSACAPEKFTPEIERNLITIFNQSGLPLSYSTCFIKVIEKEYTVKSLIVALLRDREQMQGMLLHLFSKCMEE